MKNLTGLFLLALTLAACTKLEKEAKVYTTFSGNIKGAQIDSIFLYSDTLHIKLMVNDGRFSDTLDLDSGYYDLSIGKETTAMYWEPGFQIDMSINVNEFDETVSYQGVGAEENNALAKAYLVQEQMVPSGKDFYGSEPQAFIDLVMELKKELHLLMDSSGGNPSFITHEKKNTSYLVNRYLYSYESAHQYYLGLDSFQVSQGFYDNISEFSKDDEAEYIQSQEYRNLIQIYIQNRVSQMQSEGKTELEALQAIIPEVESSKIKFGILNFAASHLLAPKPNLDEALDFLLEHVEDTAYHKVYKRMHETQSALMPGMESPTFRGYESHSGDSISLSDLAGKYTYIDVWATWCGPCLREIPYLKEMEEKYHNAKVNFVSISVDRRSAYETWRKMVSEKELGGIQLFADNDWSSEFVKAYGINGIPRFILVDPDGKIVDSNAPRPSDPKLDALFQELKI